MYNTPELKREFALAYLRNPSDSFGAALVVCPHDPGKALEIASTWPRDPEVIAHQREAEEELGEMHFLPGKADLARQVWEIGTNKQIDTADRLKAMKLYADLRGYIEAPSTIINNNNAVSNNKVMVIENYGSDDDWEERVRQQQAKLVEDASVQTI